MFLLMSGTNDLPKIIFLPHFEIVQNFHFFVTSTPVDFLSKISIFQKLPQMLLKCFFWWVEQIICQKKYFLTPFWDSTKFSLFCKVRACRFSVKNSIFQKLPQMLLKCFFWWVEQIILPKNIFLPHFEIVQNFHYFLRSVPVDFLSKIQFSKNSLKCCRNVSFDEWNK